MRLLRVRPPASRHGELTRITDAEISPILACPRCLAALAVFDDQLMCRGCGSTYVLRDGIPMLCSHEDFYYGEVGRPEMREILKDTRQSGWRAAMWHHSLRSESDYFLKYVTSPSRAMSKFLLSDFGEADVLDYGCGLGALTTSLASSFRSVIGLDLTYERAAFTELRAQQDGLENVSVLCAGDLEHIPLQQGSVDVVILNGILEWYPEWRGGDPHQQQVRLLREIHRILRPTGQLFIGIENRAALRYFLGYPEDHTRLRFASLLPRLVADFYSKAVRKKPFRNYTYTRRGYSRLLQKAGFGKAKFYGILPNYREIERIVDFSAPSVRAASLEGRTPIRRMRNFVLRPLLPSVIHSYGIVANCGETRSPSFLEELLAHLEKEGLCGGSCEAERFSSSPYTSTVHLRVLAKNERFVVRAPLTLHAEDRLVREREVLLEVQRSLSEPFRQMVPRVTGTGRLRGQFYSVASWLPGVDLAAEKGQILEVLPEVCDFAADLTANTRTPCKSWRELIHAQAKSAAANLFSASRQRFGGFEELSKKLDTIVELLRQDVPDTPGFACALHGDFWPGNVLVESRHVSGVLDWDWFQAYSAPGIDLLCFLAWDLGQSHNWQDGNEFVELYRGLTTPGPYTHFVGQFTSSVGLDRALLPALTILAWMHRVNCVLSDPDIFLAREVMQLKMADAAKFFSRLEQLGPAERRSAS